MTFLEALKSRRPIRRNHAGWDDYIYLGQGNSSPQARPVWRNIRTGETRPLNLFDYEATDWEVMP